MEITITVSDRTAEIIQHKAEENGKDVDEFLGEFVEENFTNENGTENSAESQSQRPFMRMQGMFSSGKTDTSERMHEILYSEDFDPAEGFSIRK